jgi:hypothetical protein
MKVSHRITRLVLIGLAVLALAAPAASATPAPADAQPAERVVVQPPVVQSIDDGFDWGSAALGAGVAGGIILLAAWGGMTYRHRHDHVGVAH